MRLGGANYVIACGWRLHGTLAFEAGDAADDNLTDGRKHYLIHTISLGELQTFRTQDLSLNERSLWRTFVPQEGKFQELSFPGPFVPGPFLSRELSFPYFALVYKSILGVVIDR